MNNLTNNEVFILAWIVKKIRADMEILKFEKDPVLRQVRIKAILDFVRNTNDDNDGLLEAVFITHFQEDNFQWRDVIVPNAFEISIGRYAEKLEVFLKTQ